MIKFNKIKGIEKESAVSQATAGRLCVGYSIFTLVLLLPLIWLIHRSVEAAGIAAVLAVYFFGRGTYLLRIRKKPVKRKIVPGSLTSRWLMSKGLRIVPLFVAADILLMIAVLAAISFIAGDEAERHELTGNLAVLAILAAIKHTDEQLLDYFALRNYYNGKGTDRIQRS
ncbi:MAG: hypothetical protein J6C31_01710 [Prevotella sp.]|nr:hypothetical protein [Prevotella sp.]